MTESPEEFGELLEYEAGSWTEEAPMVAGHHHEARWYGICINRKVLLGEQTRRGAFNGVTFMSMLSHEVAHVAAYITESINDFPTGQNDMEQFCFLQEYLMRLTLRHLGYR